MPNTQDNTHATDLAALQNVSEQDSAALERQLDEIAAHEAHMDRLDLRITATESRVDAAEQAFLARRVQA